MGGRLNVSRCPWLSLVIGTVLLVATATPSTADLVTVPTSLSPGDPYRLAFVTSTTLKALSSDISVYNTFVDDVAELVPELAALNQDWKVIASTGTVDARDNTSTVPSTITGGSLGVPIFLLNDTKLVDSNDDLWDGNIDVAFAVNQMGDAMAWDTVWTGTGSDGVGVGGKQLGADTVLYGRNWALTEAWVDWSTLSPSSSVAHLYAISGELSVAAVPEPGSITLMAIGAVGLMGFGRIRKRQTATSRRNRPSSR